MKRLFSLCAVVSILISSIGVSAIDKKTAEQFKKDKSTFWYNDKDLQQTVYYKNGEVLKNDWVIQNNRKYYLKEDGIMTIGWKLINNNWYFFNGIGVMQTGWLKEGANWYYLNTDGTMAHDTTISGYYVNSNGVWVQ
jgi:glucan-binding YG repeat protein